MVPADLATIYNLNPAFAAGVTGTGQTIAVIENTNLQNPSDVATFRSAFGLSGYSGTFTQVNPSGAATCNNPGVNADEVEAALDAEWAGASAPNAAIVLASCADTITDYGTLNAILNLINGSNPPQVLSLSYGDCEQGADGDLYVSNIYQQAAAEGVSVFVSAGDQGAAVCDAGLNNGYAISGIWVNYLADTAYNVAVGGTDFGDIYASKNGGPALSKYWNGSNTSVFRSALSYIPEIPWNDSCASKLIFTTNGYSSGYGSSGFCNHTSEYLTIAAGSGGPSAYYSKPSWQSLVGNPSDGARDLPDVSLFAADGVWDHFFGILHERYGPTRRALQLQQRHGCS